MVMNILDGQADGEGGVLSSMQHLLSKITLATKFVDVNGVFCDSSEL